MSDKFFIAFKNMEVARDFYEVLNLMNKNAGHAIVKVERDVEMNKQHGLLISNIGDDVCYGILWCKYFMLHNGRHPSVYFWDEEYEKYCESKKAAEVVIA